MITSNEEGKTNTFYTVKIVAKAQAILPSSETNTFYTVTSLGDPRAIASRSATSSWCAPIVRIKPRRNLLPTKLILCQAFVAHFLSKPITKQRDQFHWKPRQVIWPGNLFFPPTKRSTRVLSIYANVSVVLLHTYDSNNCESRPQRRGQSVQFA